MIKYKKRHPRAAKKSNIAHIRAIETIILNGAPIKNVKLTNPLSSMIMSFEAKVTNFPAPARAKDFWFNLSNF